MSDQQPPDTPSQDDFEEQVKAELRARGLNPDNLSAQEMIGLMQDAVMRIVQSLQSATAQADNLEIRDELDALLDQAEQLQQDLGKLDREMDDQEQDDQKPGDKS